MRSDKDKAAQAAQAAIDEDMLLQHISALNAKLTIAFEKKIEPLGNQIIAYREVVAPLSQDLKRNLAQMTPLMQQVQLLETSLTTAIQTVEQDRHAALADIASLRTDVTNTLEALRETLSQEMSAVKAAAETPPADTSGEVRAEIQALHPAIETLQARLDAIEAALAAKADSVLDAMSTQLDALQQQAESGRVANAGISTDDMAALTDAIGDMRNVVQAGLDTALQTANQNVQGQTDAVRDEIKGELDRVEQTMAQQNSAQIDAIDATKYALQSDISSTFLSWQESVQALTGKFDALTETVTSLGEQINNREVVNAPVETVYQPVGSDLPDIIRDRVDEVHSRLTNSDWAIQSIGKNMTTLMHEVSAMRDDVLSASMARRTYTAVEDIRALVEDMPRRGAESSKAEELAARLESTLDSVRTAISARPDDLAGTLEQAKSEILETLQSSSDKVSAPIDQSRQEILSAVQSLQSMNSEIGSQISQAIASHSDLLIHHVESKMDEMGASRSDASRTMASIESAALQKMAWSQQSYNGPRPKPLAGYDGSAAIGQLQAEYPEVFEHWHPVFQNGATTYLQSRDANCSTFDNAMTRCFRDYLSLFATGAILDIGCGPFADPAYLGGLSAEQLTGLEPLDIVGKERFPVERGVNEFLPWADHSFETVISATSLDHVIDLKKSLSEVHRVLKSDGVYILWYANVVGSENITAKPASEQSAVDNYHLFHIDEAWFSELIGEWFDLVDYRRFKASETVSDVFAVYRPRTLTKPTAKAKRAAPTKKAGTRKPRGKSKSSKT